jgi:peptide/nickel transport system ATP-binding protein
VIRISSLNISFKQENQVLHILKDINFEVNAGEILGIVGESGSGKSVTSLSIMGLLAPNAIINSGEILFETKKNKTVNLLQISEKEFQKIRGNDISMIFQEPMTSLNPIQKCGPQVAEIITYHNKKISSKDAKQKTIELFEDAQIPRPEKIYDVYPHQISGGQKQRVMIAMALANNPKLLIADEPTTALDVTVQKTILNTLKNLQQKYKMSVIFITHDLGVVAEIADRVIVMKNGEIVEENKTENIFKNAKHPYTKGLIACRPNTKLRYEKLPTVKDFVENDGDFKAKIISAEERKIQHKKIYSAEPILKVRNLNTRFSIEKNIFGKTKKYLNAVDNISFDVYENETLGLVGESGCGKTTLGRSLMQMIESNSGSIEYKGIEITQLSNKELRKIKRNIQIIFQDPYSSLNPRLTVGEAIMEPMMVHKIVNSKQERRKKAIELLEKVNLKEEHLERYPHEFSGGQRQRIVVARTLAMKPEFIICDESVSALDVSVQAQVLNLLNELKNEFNFTYIFISHDLSVVKFISDRIIIMKNGKIVEQGEADEIYANPKEEYTKSLINSNPKIEVFI